MRHVDTHVHFWDAAARRHPWLDGVPALPRRANPGTYLAALGDAAPELFVFVEADAAPAYALGEVAWVEALACHEPRLAAIVAQARLDAGPATVAALKQLAARPLVRGVRHLVQDEPAAGFVLRDAFVAGARLLAEYDLTCELCCRAQQLDDMAALIARCPDTRFVLNHGGKPAIASRESEKWRRALGAVAARPNVVCKLSGLVTEAAPDWQAADLAPYVQALLETFGPDRLMYGSDWPVVTIAADARRWFDTAIALTAHRRPAEREAIFSDNARRVYRLPSHLPTRY